MLRPVLLGAPRRDGEALLLDAGADEIRIEGPVDALLQALARCDGRTTLEDVLADVEAELRDAVAEVLQRLAAAGAVVDREHAFLLTHRLGETSHMDEGADGGWPPTWVPAGRADEAVHLPVRKSTLTDLLRTRRSATSDAFEAPAASGAALLAVAAAAQGPVPGGRRTTPSAGALYPMVVHLCVPRDVDGLAAGTWWIDASNGAARRIGTEGDLRPEVLADPRTGPSLERASAFLTLSVDAERTSAKYGNRGYRYLLLEAGASMQNALLAAAELEVGARAYGLFDDQAVRQHLEVPQRVLPVVVLALG